MGSPEPGGGGAGGAREGPAAHVYVHVPFCARKCPYCDFASYAGRDDLADAYVEAVLAEARRRLGGVPTLTLYVGGGTPTHLGAERLGRLLEGLLAAAGGSAPAEFTVEANPGTVDAATARTLARAGVTRVSLGAQSFDDRHLARLGRIHVAADVARSAHLVRAAGVPDLSLDLILALPGQTLAEQARDVASAIALAPGHVSAYVLTIEPGTAFGRDVEAGRLPPPDSDREAGHLRVAVDGLRAAGYARYEVSNFARPGRECRHNLAYWRDADWVGLGASAHSHVAPRRRSNVEDPAEYVRRMRGGEDPGASVEHSPPAVELFEALLMGLRVAEGVDLAALERRTGLDARTVHAAAIARHVANGCLRLEEGRLRPTERGLDVLSRVLLDFVPEADGP